MIIELMFNIQIAIAKMLIAIQIQKHFTIYHYYIDNRHIVHW